MRKKVLFGTIAALIVGIMLCSIGCAAKEEEYTTVDSLMKQFYNFPPTGIVETDIYELNQLAKKMREADYRVCGVVSDIEEYKYFIAADLTDGENTIHIYFVPTETPKDGEYVEVVGWLVVDSALTYIENAVIVERGASVRERMGE